MIIKQNQIDFIKNESNKVTTKFKKLITKQNLNLVGIINKLMYILIQVVYLELLCFWNIDH
jgi:hypothetical protein